MTFLIDYYITAENILNIKIFIGSMNMIYSALLQKKN